MDDGFKKEQCLFASVWRFVLLKSPSGDGLVGREQVIRLKVHNDCSLSLGYQQCGHAYVFLDSKISLSQSKGCSRPLTSLRFECLGNCCSGLQSVVLKNWNLERNKTGTSALLFHTFWLLWFSLTLNLSLLSPFPLDLWSLSDLTIHPQFPCYCHPSYTWLMRNMWLFNTS